MTVSNASELVAQFRTASRSADVARVLRRGGAIALTLLLLWVLGDVMLMIFAAALLAVALRGASDWIAAHTRWSAEKSLVIVSVILVLTIVMGVRFSGPPLAEQGNQLWDQSVKMFDSGREWLQQFSWIRPIVDGASAQQIAESSQKIASNLGIALMSVLGALTSTVIVIVAAFYFAASPGLYVSGLVRLLPRHQRIRGRQFLQECAGVLRLWLQGQGIAMVLIAAITYVGLALLGVPLAPLLALIAGLTNFVPYVGPFVGAMPALVVALGVGPQTAVSVALLFIVVQFVEGNFITPQIQRRISHLPPAMTILSQLAMGTLFGAAGVLLATPLLAVMLLGAKVLYIEGMLDARHQRTASVLPPASRQVC